MRDFILVFVAALFASVFTYLIADRAASAQAHSAAVVADEEHGVVRIVIDGKDVARFEGSGLHVRDDIRFGGVIADVGYEGFAQNGKGE